MNLAERRNRIGAEYQAEDRHRCCKRVVRQVERVRVHHSGANRQTGFDGAGGDARHHAGRGVDRRDCGPASRRHQRGAARAGRDVETGRACRQRERVERRLGVLIGQRLEDGLVAADVFVPKDRALIVLRTGGRHI